MTRGYATGTATPLFTVLNNGYAGIGISEPVSALEVAGSAFITGRSVPTTGAGLEAFYSSGSYLLSYDRTNSSYRPLALDGSDLEFNIAGTEKMRLAANGYLGIGTPNPAVALHLESSTTQTGRTLRLAFDSTYYGELSQLGASGLNINSAGGALSFSTFGSEAMRITSSGKVGLGTITPNANSKLTVAGGFVAEGASGSIYTTADFGPYTATGVLLKAAPAKPSIVANLGTSGDANSAFTVYDSATIPRFLVRADGNVGIGTPTPSHPLTIQGDGPAQRITHTTASSYSGVAFYESETLQGHLAVLGSTSGAVGGPNAIQLWNFRNAPVVFATSNAERLRIDAAGNVGIGTSSPAAGMKLDVAGDTRVGGNLAVTNAATVANQTTTGSLVVTNNAAVGGNLAVTGGATVTGVTNLLSNANVSGQAVFASNVGIGTPTPGQKLEIAGLPSNFVQDAIRVSTGTAVNVSGFKMVGGTGGGSDIVRIANTDGTVYAGWLNLYRDGGSKVQITASPGYPTYFNSGGNVGIGTATPGQKLTIEGSGTGVPSASAAFNELGVRQWILGAGLTASGKFSLVNGSSGLDAITVDGASNVGIGVPAPSQKFEVAGNAVITGSLQSDTSGAATASLSLGSATAGAGGSLKLLSSGGNWGFANSAGAFSLTRGSTAVLSFASGSDNTAIFASGLSARSLDVNTGTISRLADATNATDAMNKQSVERLIPFRWNSPYITLKNAGDRLGIGTSSPDAPLHILGHVGRQVAKFQGEQGVSNNRNFVSFYSTNPEFWWELSNQDPTGAGAVNGFAFRERSGSGGSVARVYFAPGGNVGVGTTTPDASLSVISTNGGPGGSWSNPGSYAAQFHNDSNSSQSNGLLVSNVWRAGDSFVFAVDGRSAGNPGAHDPYFVVRGDGNVGIGTDAPNDYKLAVKGAIHAQEVVVDLLGWSDYVFADGYKPMPLSELESHIREHKHLPGVPSAQEVSEKGVGLGQMQATLLAKVEELTLHLIEQEKRLKKLEEENSALRAAR